MTEEYQKTVNKNPELNNHETKSLFSTTETVKETDILIIGGGNAGLFAAYGARMKDPSVKITILEKSNIDRSGCLAAGMDAINSYIGKDRDAEDFVRWSRWQAGGLIREDLTLSLAKRLDDTTHLLEEWGVPFPKDENGGYLRRGRWDIDMYGEHMKPIMSEKVKSLGVEVLNRVYATNLIVDNGRVTGVYGFNTRTGEFYVIKAKSVIIATGGASNLYKTSTNDGSDAHHQLWYYPGNVGSGYAMGIRAGAEMTLFEMRLILARTKDYNGPVDTISGGYHLPMINSKDEKVLQKRGGETIPRFLRAEAVVDEWLNGSAPTYVDSRGIPEEDLRDIESDYLNERPSFLLFLASNKIDLTKEPLEIFVSEPYITGGHSGSGYWISESRETTLPGLYAIGDVAGGCPNKFVSGAGAEGLIAGEDAVEKVKESGKVSADYNKEAVADERKKILAPYERYYSAPSKYTNNQPDGITAMEVEERLQRLMDEYAGGFSQFYRLSEERLQYALKHIRMLREDAQKHFVAKDLHEVMRCLEVFDLLDVAETLVIHLSARKETRWLGWQTRIDYPERNDKEFDCFLNSRRDPETGKTEMLKREYEQIVSGDRYTYTPGGK